MNALVADGGYALVVAAVISVIVSAVGAQLTVIGPWYNNLRFPSWKPPNWAFPVVWTTIFVLITLAAAIMWNSAETETMRRVIILAFAVNAVLNMAWSWFFFTLRRPDWALVEVVVFWVSIVVLIAVAVQVSMTAAVLLAPYLIWVTVASVLNWSVVRLNSPLPA